MQSIASRLSPREIMVEQSHSLCRTRMYVSPHPWTDCMIRRLELVRKPSLGTGQCLISYANETLRRTHSNITGRQLGDRLAENLKGKGENEFDASLRRTAASAN